MNATAAPVHAIQDEGEVRTEHPVKPAGAGALAAFFLGLLVGRRQKSGSQDKT